MGEPSAEIDVIFVGQTGVGKSSLINMIMGVSAARVSNDAHPCTIHTTSYSTSLDPDSPCRLWDTRGLDEAAGTSDRRFMVKIVDRIRQLANQQARELKDTLRDRTRLAIPILIWCIDATKIDVAPHWQQFYKVYVEFCERRAIPAVVITRGPPKASDWPEKCADRLQGLGLGGDIDIPVKMVRRYRSPSSAEYRDDAIVLKDLILELMKRDP